jgi:hypothetical protein
MGLPGGDVNARAVAAVLASQHVELDREVLRLDAERWMIHGSIAYEGEIIAAVFASEGEAWAVVSAASPRTDG